MRISGIVTAIVLATAPVLASAQAITVPFEGSFEDATFAVENAVVNRGLVIDYTSHVGEMLNRTGADVGSEVKIFENADIFLFCSAVVSREVMEADPMNIVNCPYSIFVAETQEGVMIGYRDYPEGPMDKVEALLEEIVAEAVAY
jgi:uncharacterized protein (DUF302 family)